MEIVTVSETLAIFSTTYFPRRLAGFAHSEGLKSHRISTVLSHTLKFLVFLSSEQEKHISLVRCWQ
jgi:hypothetical protein